MYKETRKNKEMPVGASLVLARLQRNYQNKSNNTSNSGITLIALIITIIILLILAMTSVALVMRNGIIKHTQDAAEKYQIAAEKEEIELAYEEYVMNGLKDKDADLKMDEKEAKVTTNKDGEDNKIGWTVKFENSGNEYDVNNNGNITGPKTGGSLVGGGTGTEGGGAQPGDGGEEQGDEPSTKVDMIIEGQTWDGVQIKGLPEEEPEEFKKFEPEQEGFPAFQCMIDEDGDDESEWGISLSKFNDVNR